MKSPKATSARRPCRTSPALARTPKEAAMHLVRLEFDVSRLEKALEAARSRMARCAQDLERRKREREILLALLGR
ncbi:hypothetical protein GQF56_16420 [Rhodobacter sphaeroides]|jgi:hypothetical protein|uniref:Uncharacterized protein n=2 Tax=Cereibacter sphaeroides TaxID=1063 RepID=Q3IWA0_CERS4|nr:hypothetical protein [Cereibacter sphaeroides]ABA81184.1 hypothetical protein RSP_6184 [Cereibacter sphaeroides 2.4.1]AXC63476.1 hypothetical protein DQL45_18995 [Cereibacter sphaeroides 2.4.1]MVX49436.1 hypothetical protein [Cereibacter sphaeroides]QHA11934.1 hypothetical protein GQR99_18975 [Cereibacter sphaeroides]QHA15064.1 hypothetical protein GQY06_18945 [Cereibacter sphaeroides]